MSEPSIPPPPGQKPTAPDMTRFARMRTIDKVILGVLILVVALCLAAAYVALSDWFMGPSDSGGISTLRVCLYGIAALVVVTVVLFIVRFLTRSPRRATGS